MPRIFMGAGSASARVVVSLCDYSANWPRPYIDAWYTVICFDTKHGTDIMRVPEIDAAVQSLLGLLPEGARVVGVLAAPPCTDFSVSGAQYWPAKDADGRTAKSLTIVDACLTLIGRWKPDWWALENPVGRLPKLRPKMGKPAYYFDPYQYAYAAQDPQAERYTKKTGIWGNADMPRPRCLPELAPIKVCSQGSWVQKLGGKSERTKELRSMTPTGFAKAFFHANP